MVKKANASDLNSKLCQNIGSTIAVFPVPTWFPSYDLRKSNCTAEGVEKGRREGVAKSQGSTSINSASENFAVLFSAI